MLEAEVKILGINRAEIEDKLVAMGARLVFDDEMHAIYYDSPGKTIGSTGGAFRLRREGSKAVLTYKKHVSDGAAKVREEFDVGVSDFETMRRMLDALGYQPWLEMKKRRRSWDLPGIRFEFDMHLDDDDYIPEYLEMEASDIAVIYDYARRLGFSETDCLDWDVHKTALYYRGKK